MAGRVVIVTCGFGVLGRAVSQAFAARGDSGAGAALDVGGVDIADLRKAQSAVEQVAAKLGEESVLVNVAGGFIWETFETVGAASYDRMFRVNLLTAANMAKAALPMLRRWPAAAIIKIGALAAWQAGSGMGAYASSKAAVHRLTESLAKDVEGSSFRVNAVLRSIIDTPANRAAMPDAGPRQWVDPAAVAEVILFLASHRARGMNGALVPVARGQA